MHSLFIQAMQYTPEDKKDYRFGFDFLSRSTQRRFLQGVRLCFESDLLFSACRRHYRGKNNELRPTTSWQRETAEIFCQDGIWKTLGDKAKDENARQAIQKLRRRFQPHALFAHHTLESLLSVANTILPVLQNEVRQAQRMRNRWGWLPWVPNHFIRHYQRYLKKMREQLTLLEEQLLAAIDIRLQMAFSSANNDCDVVLALVHQLRAHAPGFLSEARLAEDARSATFEQLLRGKNLALPQTKRRATFSELANALNYFNQHPQRRPQLVKWCHRLVVEDKDLPLTLTPIQMKKEFLFIPQKWLSRQIRDGRAIREAYPWCRNWSLPLSLSILQAERAVVGLLWEKEAPSSILGTITGQCDRVDAIIRGEETLQCYRDTIQRYRPRGIRYWFIDWKKTKQYREHQAHLAQLDGTLAYLHEAKVDWLLSNIETYKKECHAYSSKTWLTLLRIVDNIIIAESKRFNVQVMARLIEHYYTLQLLSVNVLKDVPDADCRYCGEPARLLCALTQLASKQTLLSPELWQMTEHFIDTLQQHPNLNPLWQQQAKVILQDCRKTWCDMIFSLCDAHPLTLTEEEKHHGMEVFFQLSTLLFRFSPTFVEDRDVQHAYQYLRDTVQRRQHNRSSALAMQDKTCQGYLDTCRHYFTKARSEVHKISSQVPIPNASVNMTSNKVKEIPAVNTIDDLRNEMTVEDAVKKEKVRQEENVHPQSVSKQTTSPVGSSMSENKDYMTIPTRPLKKSTSETVPRVMIPSRCKDVCHTPSDGISQKVLIPSTQNLQMPKQHEKISQPTTMIKGTSRTDNDATIPIRIVNTISDDEGDDMPILSSPAALSTALPRIDYREWLNELANAFVGQGKPPLSTAVVKTLLGIGRAMAQDNVYDILMWPKRTTLTMALRGMLKLDPAPKPNPISNWFFGPAKPSLVTDVIEQRGLVNIAAYLYRLQEEGLAQGKSNETLTKVDAQYNVLLQHFCAKTLLTLQPLVQTPTVKVFVNTLLTALSEKPSEQQGQVLSTFKECVF